MGNKSRLMTTEYEERLSYNDDKIFYPERLEGQRTIFSSQNIEEIKTVIDNLKTT